MNRAAFVLGSYRLRFTDRRNYLSLQQSDIRVPAADCSPPPAARTDGSTSTEPSATCFASRSSWSLVLTRLAILASAALPRTVAAAMDLSNRLLPFPAESGQATSWSG